MIGKSKKDLYIHIGTGKTGTTALQGLCWANRSLLKRKHGVLYPNLGVVAGAHHLLSPESTQYLSQEIIPAETWAPSLHSRADKRVLLSSELMSSASADSIRGFAETIGPYFDVKIVVYVRRQDHWVIASYSQQVKAGTQRADLMSSRNYWSRAADHAKRLKPWLDAFGAENIIVRPYEGRQMSCRDVRNDFLEKILGIGDVSRFKFSATNDNPRLVAAALEYKRLINNVTHDPKLSNQFNKPLLAYSDAKTGTASTIYHESDLLSGVERRKIIQQHRDGNAWIARTLMARSDGILFTDPEPLDDPNWEPTVVTEEDLADVGDFLKVQRLDNALMGHIDRAMELNKAESLRAARALAASIGRAL